MSKWSVRELHQTSVKLVSATALNQQNTTTNIVLQKQHQQHQQQKCDLFHIFCVC